MSKKINIAIDGHSSCGKSTIAKSISQKFQMRYIDTGAMYRAITLFCLQNNLISEGIVNTKGLKKHLDSINLGFEYNSENKVSETFLNGENIENKIRGLQVSENVSFVAKIPFVRKKLVLLQQEIGKEKNVVMDGRDIGTKVFPDAEIKFFVTADVQIRAKRRFEEMNSKDVSFDQILNNLKMRDENDTRRDTNPLKMAEDAILIDNSDKSLEQQNNFVFSKIEKVLKNGN
ncbi:MAG: cytidylate kinase [Flavobacteriales bacterium]|nr:cytidylate kinase [Flavobacteriales bacterium]|tara:strand:- start:1385 stop:2077 length:693 start_codon:yes stop_codon:yes gene_type:complete